MTTMPPRPRSHSDVRAILTRVGVEPKQIDEILGSYPDPIDLNAAGPALAEKYGITHELLMDRLGGSP
jgi:hypothetical protein